jgi:hypothetical protein
MQPIVPKIMYGAVYETYPSGAKVTCTVSYLPHSCQSCPIHRRVRSDMIEVYKIVSGLYDFDAAPQLNLVKNKVTRPRGHPFKLCTELPHICSLCNIINYCL